MMAASELKAFQINIKIATERDAFALQVWIEYDVGLIHRREDYDEGIMVANISKWIELVQDESR